VYLVPDSSIRRRNQFDNFHIQLLSAASLMVMQGRMFVSHAGLGHRKSDPEDCAWKHSNDFLTP
jgi:hypothetical protein